MHDAEAVLHPGRGGRFEARLAGVAHPDTHDLLARGLELDEHIGGQAPGARAFAERGDGVAEDVLEHDTQVGAVHVHRHPIRDRPHHHLVELDLAARPLGPGRGQDVAQERFVDRAVRQGRHQLGQPAIQPLEVLQGLPHPPRRPGLAAGHGAAEHRESAIGRAERRIGTRQTKPQTQRALDPVDVCAPGRQQGLALAQPLAQEPALLGRRPPFAQGGQGFAGRADTMLEELVPQAADLVGHRLVDLGTAQDDVAQWALVAAPDDEQHGKQDQQTAGCHQRDRQEPARASHRRRGRRWRAVSFEPGGQDVPAAAQARELGARGGCFRQGRQVREVLLVEVGRAPQYAPVAASPRERQVERGIHGRQGQRVREGFAQVRILGAQQLHRATIEEVGLLQTRPRLVPAWLTWIQLGPRLVRAPVPAPPFRLGLFPLRLVDLGNRRPTAHAKGDAHPG